MSRARVYERKGKISVRLTGAGVGQVHRGMALRDSDGVFRGSVCEMKPASVGYEGRRVQFEMSEAELRERLKEAGEEIRIRF